MIDSDALEAQRARKRAYSRARYEANRDKILAAKRKREREKALYTAVKVCERPTRYCLECGAELPEGHHPVDYCDWKEYRAHFKREYAAVEVPSLPACERRRR